VTFVSSTQTGGRCPGTSVSPTQGTFTVNNPSTTCVDAGLDAGASDAVADAPTDSPREAAVDGEADGGGGVWLGQQLEEHRAGDRMHERRSGLHLCARQARPLRRTHRALRRRRVLHLSEPALSEHERGPGRSYGSERSTIVSQSIMAWTFWAD